MDSQSNKHMDIAKRIIDKLNSKGTQIIPGPTYNSWLAFKDHRWTDYVLSYSDISDAILQAYDYHCSTKLDRMVYEGHRREIVKCISKILIKPDMDANMNLLGFNNGVFELDSRKFRPGKPEDYISITTGYDYVSISPNDPAYLKTMMFLSELLPDPVVRDKWLELLASCLSGNRDVFRPNEFNVMLGSGANGKSTMMRLVKLAFGEYCDMISPGLIRSITTRWNKFRLVFVNEDEHLQENSLVVNGIGNGLWNYNINNEQIIHRVVTGKPVFYKELYHEGHEVTARSKIIYCGRNRPNLEHGLLDTEYINFTPDFSSAGRQIDTNSMKHAFMSILLNYRYAKYAKIIQCVWRKARDNPYCTVGQNCINHSYDSLVRKQ
jgi:hypothetical protein